MKPSEFVYAARDEIAKGWCQNTLEDHIGNVCAMGAVGRVFGRDYQRTEVNSPQWWDNIDNHRTVVKGLDYYAKQEHGFVLGIVAMNDSQRTTQQDMVNAFHKVGLMFEERGE